MEVKINREIRDVKERVLMGFTFRQAAFLALGLSIAAALFLLLRSVIDMTTLTVLCAIAGMPVILIGFADHQHMSGTDLVLEFIQSYFLMKHETQHVPKNMYRDMLTYIRENSPESIKKRKKTAGKKIIAAVCLASALMLVIFSLNAKIRQDEIREYAHESYLRMRESTDLDFYSDRQAAKALSLISEMREKMSEESTKEGIDEIYESFEISLESIDTKAGEMSEIYTQLWLDEKTGKDQFLVSQINQGAKEIASSRFESELRSNVFLSDKRIRQAIYESTGKTENRDTMAEYAKEESGENIEE